MIEPIEKDVEGSAHPNLALVIQAGEVLTKGSKPDEDLFAEDFTLHYFNARLPDLAGDYHGLDGMRDFLARLQRLSDGSFQIEPISLTPFGDELVAAYVTNTLSVADTVLEFDALMLWRVYEGQIHEAWDIPAINTSRTPDTDAAA